MIKVGLTGSIGSGKTLVTRIFRIMGVSIYHADIEARKFLLQDAVRKLVTDQIDGDFNDKNNNIIPGKLAGIVFTNPQALVVLNDILHPLVKSDLTHWLNSRIKEPYAICEAAILFESGFYKEFDKIISVDAPDELRLLRVMQRDGMTRKEILNRMQNQLSGREKVQRADFVIINDERHMLIPQVLKIHQMLMKLAGSEQ
ncbi:MAG: dephospho-CoA kinase [Bacteroidetes bacterium]|nr:dephospho-CoA kinase [Bacteroidota bacterium]